MSWLTIFIVQPRPFQLSRSKKCTTAVMSRISLFCVLLMAAIASSCVKPDCDYPDCGSCGNACCAVDFMFKEQPHLIVEAMTKLLRKGGPDGRYTLSDLYNLSSDKLVHHPQEVYGSIHSTLVHHYNDTQFFVVNAEPEGATTIRGFSNSIIVGAYCDEGQNYKNVVGLVKGLEPDFKFEKMNVVFGCTNATRNYN